MKERWREVE